MKANAKCVCLGRESASGAIFARDLHDRKTARILGRYCGLSSVPTLEVHLVRHGVTRQFLEVARDRLRAMHNFYSRVADPVRDMPWGEMRRARSERGSLREEA